MIEITLYINDLNPIDRDLLKLEYGYGSEDRMHKWVEQYDRSLNRYRSRKSELLLMMSFTFLDEWSMDEWR